MDRKNHWEIIQMAGFYKLSYFIWACKKETGTIPGAY